MKKIIALITALLCLSVGFSVSADSKLTGRVDKTSEKKYVSAQISDDLGSLIFEDNTYVKFNDNLMYYDMKLELNYEVALTAEQAEKYKSVKLIPADNFCILYAEIELHGGGEISLSYIKLDYFEEYGSITSGKWNEAEIDFAYPEDNSLKTTREELFGKTADQIKAFDSDKLNDYFSVYAYPADRAFSVFVGEVIDYKGDYYYIDALENNLTDTLNYDIEGNEGKTFIAHKIEGVLFKNVEKGVDRYYSEDLGFLGDDSFTAKVSDIFLVLMFGVLPFGIFITFLILAILKKDYRKFYTVIYASALVEVIIFTVLAIMVK